MKLCFEYDDYPRGGREMLRHFDRLRDRFPHFKANVFAIPREMTKLWHKEIARRPWLRLYPHGISHVRGECRIPPSGSARRLIKLLSEDDRWGPVFKAPWHGYCPEFVEFLHRYGFAAAVTNLNDWPMPMPSDWKVFSHRCLISESLMHQEEHWWPDPDRKVERRRKYQPSHTGFFIESHPVYEPRSAGARKTELTESHIKWWSERWTRRTRWAFCEELLRPACLKLPSWLWISGSQNGTPDGRNLKSSSGFLWLTSGRSLRRHKPRISREHMPLRESPSELWHHSCPTERLVTLNVPTSISLSRARPGSHEMSSLRICRSQRCLIPLA